MSNNNILIELSNRNATTKQSNAEFQCCFQPTTINNGDVITIKNVFIDTVQQNYDQINISEDTAVSMTFCFYEMFLPHYGGSRNIIDVSGVYQHSNVMFFAVDPNGNNPQLIKHTHTFTLKKGIYTPDSLAIEMSKLMSLTTLQGLGHWYIGRNAAGPTDIYLPIIAPSNPFLMNVFLEKGVSPALPFIFPDISNNSFSNVRFCPFDQEHKKVKISEFYNYKLFVSDNHSGIADMQDTRFIFTGARQVALVFNNDNSNKFEFQYLHTPYYDANGNESVGIVVEQGDVNQAVYSITRDTGIVFTDLQPRSLFENLGFDLDAMLLQVGPTSNDRIPILNFDNTNMTTENFLSLDDMFVIQGVGKRSQPSAQTWLTGPYTSADGVLKQSNTTRGIPASQFSSFSVLSPYIIVELISNFSTDYIDAKDSKKFISAIVSRNYTQNNFITGYSDVAITYQHIGESFILSNVGVRFIDPTTEAVMTKDLNANNYVILQILKK